MKTADKFVQGQYISHAKFLMDCNPRNDQRLPVRDIALVASILTLASALVAGTEVTFTTDNATLDRIYSTVESLIKKGAEYHD